MARELPIFPLPIVLFPGAPQSLHIFEPRYRRLLSDCLAADRRFGIAYVAAERAPSADPAPDPGAVGCVALIHSTRRLPDGRSNIVTVGERRFVLLEWLDADRPYWVARVAEFDDERTEPNEAATLAAAVRQRFARLARALGALAGSDEEAIELSEDPERLSFQVAAALELEPDAQRALQALRSTTTRLRQLGALLEPLAADARRRAAVRQRAKRNGTGGAHPRVERTT